MVDVTYKWTCLNCIREWGEKVLYLGEKSRVLWDRAQEHLDYPRRRSKNLFYIDTGWNIMQMNRN